MKPIGFGKTKHNLIYKSDDYDDCLSNYECLFKQTESWYLFLVNEKWELD